MTRSEISNQLNEVFREVFDDKSIVVRDDLTAKDVPNWDSVSHIDMICAVEDKFKTRLSTRDVAGLKNVGELISLLERKAV